MLLEPQDVELFFRLHRTLMFFANQRLKVIPDKLATPEEFAALSPGVRLKVRDALNAHLDLIQSFVDENPAHLPDDELVERRGGDIEVILPGSAKVRIEMDDRPPWIRAVDALVDFTPPVAKWQ